MGKKMTSTRFPSLTQKATGKSREPLRTNTQSCGVMEPAGTRSHPRVFTGPTPWVPRPRERGSRCHRVLVGQEILQQGLQEGPVRLHHSDGPIEVHGRRGPLETSSISIP